MRTRDPEEAEGLMSTLYGKLKTQRHDSAVKRCNTVSPNIKARSRARPFLAAATMSRQPSPGLPSSHNNQMYHQQPLSSSSKQRTKPFATNIPGGADDVKYQAKYKELKKKVKEIELVRASIRQTEPHAYMHWMWLTRR